MKNLFLRMMALAIISTLIITGCGSAKAEQTTPAQAEQATTAQADTAEQATPVQADTAEQAAPAQADTAEQATPAQADTAEQATPAQADTAEQAQPAADETDVCITFSDTEEVLKCRLDGDGDTYSCSTSTHTFKMRGVEKIEGQYTFEELPQEWQMMISKVRQHDKW